MDPGRVLSGRYELEHEIGSGGAAVVWRAHDRTLDRPVAIKLLHPGRGSDEGSVTRFQREARAAATLNHRNAVAIYDIGTDGDVTYIVMEHVEGPGLDEVFADGPLEPDVVAAIGFQVAAALGTAHGQGLIHRDIKPANILLAPSGQAKLADFGIAKAFGGDDTTLTQAGTVVGTVAYLAPEQIRGDDVGPQSDVYALGLVLYEAVTGQAPFGKGTAAEVTARRLATDPPAVEEVRPDVPGGLARAITRATRLDPAERFADGGELARALEELLRQEPELLVRRFVAEGAGAEPRDETKVLTAVPVPLEEDAETIAISPAHERAGNKAEKEATGEEDATGDRGPVVPPDARRPILALVTGVAVIVGAFVILGGDGGSGTEDGGDASEGPTTIEVASARDFDPFGDGEEHREDVPSAHDGDPGTAWVTERYNSADMGGLKPGVGLWFHLAESRDVGRVQLTVSPGIAFDVHVAGTPPEGTDPEAWGTRVHSVDDAAEVVAFDLPEDVQGRYVLVWVTSVGGSGQRAEIAEVRFFGR